MPGGCPEKFNGSPVTEAQKSKFKEMVDAIEAEGGVDEPYAVAMAKWEEWMTSKKHSQEDNLPIEVDIFASGEWNGDKYLDEDLDNMVENFNLFKEKLKVPLKIGHDPKQKLLQADGMPAAGWITELKRNGSKLIAKIADIPQTIKELIAKKRYGRFSSEIMWNYKNAGNIYKRVLRGVALLGADMPAVTSISDIVGMYSDIAAGELHCYHNLESQEEKSKMANELEDKIKAQEEQLKTLTQEKENSDKKIKEYELKMKSQEIETLKSKVYTLIDAGIKEGKVIPALREKMAAIVLGQEENGNVVHSYSDKNEEKKISFSGKFDLLKGIIDELPKLIDGKMYTHTDKSEDRIKGDKDKVVDGTRTYITDNSLHEKAVKLQAENKELTYSEALKIAEKQEVNQ